MTQAPQNQMSFFVISAGSEHRPRSWYEGALIDKSVEVLHSDNNSIIKKDTAPH
jgi:hypothetical protein